MYVEIPPFICGLVVLCVLLGVIAAMQYPAALREQHRIEDLVQAAICGPGGTSVALLKELYDVICSGTGWLLCPSLLFLSRRCVGVYCLVVQPTDACCRMRGMGKVASSSDTQHP